MSRREWPSMSEKNKLTEEKMVKKTLEAQINTDKTCIADDTVEKNAVVAAAKPEVVSASASRENASAGHA